MKLVRSYQKTWTDNNNVYAFSSFALHPAATDKLCKLPTATRVPAFFLHRKRMRLSHDSLTLLLIILSISRFLRLFPSQIYIKNFSFILPIAVSSFNSYLNMKYFNYALLKKYCVHRALQSLYYVYRRNDRNKSGPVSHVSRPTKH